MILESQISAMINRVYDGVERSKLGPIQSKNEQGQNVLNHIPFQTYLTILNNLTPKNIEGKMGFSEEEDNA